MLINKKDAALIADCRGGGNRTAALKKTFAMQ
jgi:hypothetical protein